MKLVRLFAELLMKTVLFTGGSLFIVVNLFIVLYPIWVQTGASSNVGDSSFLTELSLFKAYFYFLLFAFPEEFIFHFIPLGICMSIPKTKRFWPIVALVSAVIFGMMHGNWVNILIQGTAGMIYAVGFAMENKGEQGVVKALVFTTAIHAFYNLILGFWG